MLLSGGKFGGVVFERRNDGSFIFVAADESAFAEIESATDGEFTIGAGDTARTVDAIRITSNDGVWCYSETNHPNTDTADFVGFEVKR